MVGATVVVLDVVLVLVLLLVLDAVVSTTVVDVLELVDELLSALLCSSLHALAVSARAPTARPTRKRRDVMGSVCQPAAAANVQVSE